MRARTVVMLLTLAWAGLVPAPASAGDQRIDVFSDEFTPRVVTNAQPGTITWYWASGSHSVTAYEGAGFDSGVRPVGSTFAVPYDGGTIKYRCVLHSTLSATKECEGSMCGYLTDADTIDVKKPSVVITQPSSFVAVGRPDVSTGVPRHLVTIAGSAQDDVGVFGVGVRIFDATARSVEHPFTNCPQCRSSPLVSWSIEVHLLPGSYVAEAAAADTSGNTGKSRRVQFVVL